MELKIRNLHAILKKRKKLPPQKWYLDAVPFVNGFIFYECFFCKYGEIVHFQTK